ncbi:MAG: hypothetical protein HYV27_20420 [Candidatus Hydrogenedentes bacterium]|nr:hypothetical protein [Candidatus Hydrogenedentota bacterium]
MKLQERTYSFPGTSIKHLALALVLAAFTAVPCSASVVNGAFDSGLSSWTASGDVTAATEAVLGDNGTDYSLLYQGVALAPGAYRIEFDFLNLLSGDLSVDPFAFPDTFFGSLFFTDDLGAFDLAGAVFDDVTPLLDLDASGASNVNGVLGASALGGNWTHFTLDFSSNYAYAIPVFELFDLNLATGDSQVWVDNVSITPSIPNLPEPATMTLSLMGLVACVATRMRKSVNL